jgi:lipid A 3-O-deacylase
MTRILLILLFLGALIPATGQAQALPKTKKDSVTQLFRIFEDNDFFNFWGCGTDDAYTNGSRLDYFYQPAHRPRGLLGRWAPQAGDSSMDIYGWGLFQIMYTPDNISDPDWQPNDYQWGGALIATHTRYSYNPVKKYDYQTELVMGVIGPAAFARQAQSAVHHLIRYTQPMGWSHQFRNDALVNINFTAEKQLAVVGNWVQVIGGGHVYAGTMQNGAALYPMILIGKMDPYFNGFFSQYTSPGRSARGRKKWQAYFLFKPELQFFVQNAVLEGGMFSHGLDERSGDESGKATAAEPSGSLRQADPAPTKTPALQPWVPDFTYGFVFSRGAFGISLTQNVSAATLKNLYCHTVGNISLYFGW